MPATATKPKLKTPHARETALLTSWRENPLLAIQQGIIDPYNKATQNAYTMTAQQQEATEAVRALVHAKLAVYKGTATVEEQALAKKIGVSIQSGKGTGKDAWLSWMVLWFESLFPYCKIPCVSVSADQLYKVLWSEIAKWLEHSAFKPWLTLQNDKLYFNQIPEEFRGKRWFAFPKTANPKSTVEEQAETLAGIHEDYVMVAVDEASGIPEGVFQPLEGTLTGIVNFLIVIFNPTRSKGYAIDTQTVNADDWITLRWNAEESPLTNKIEHARLLDKFGRDSNPYRIRVLGLPPISDEQTMFPWDWIEEAVEREIEGYEHLPLVKAMDCGAGGDSSIIATRRGYQVYPLKRLTTPDSTVLINWAGSDIDAEQPDTFLVDTIGIGWAVEGGLRDKKGALVEAADARRTADNSDKYWNKRAEIYDRLREAFEKGLISIPDDRDLKDQLGAIKCEYKQSKLVIQDKRKIKKSLGHSPDEADALAMTFYRAPELLSKKRPKHAPPLTRHDVPLAQAWMGA